MAAHNDEFLARVLQAAQAATVVVTRDGTITFISQAGVELFGYREDAIEGRNMAEFIDPADLDESVQSFASVLHNGTRWPPALLHLVADDGSVVPAEVAGHGTFDDPVIEGAVYSVHRMDETMQLHKILGALATAEPHSDVLRLVTEMVAVHPLKLEAVVACDAEAGVFRNLATANLGDVARAALTSDDPALPWQPARQAPLARNDAPTLTLVHDLPPSVRDPLVAAGYLECWVAPLIIENDRVVGSLVVLTLETTLPGVTIRQRMRRARDVCELAFVKEDYEDQLRHAALHDRLTNIPNRARFFEALEHGVGQRVGPLTGVLYLDLDGFKPLNDSHGHAFGDRVLVEVAKRIDDALRPRDLAARLGGDEFAVLLEGLEDASVAMKVAERVQRAVEAPLSVDEVPAPVGVSIGLAVGLADGDRASLLNAADQAMYEAKRAGRGTIRIARL